MAQVQHSNVRHWTASGLTDEWGWDYEDKCLNRKTFAHAVPVARWHQLLRKNRKWNPAHKVEKNQITCQRTLNVLYYFVRMIPRGKRVNVYLSQIRDADWQKGISSRHCKSTVHLSPVNCKPLEDPIRKKMSPASVFKEKPGTTCVLQYPITIMKSLHLNHSALDF